MRKTATIILGVLVGYAAACATQQAIMPTRAQEGDGSGKYTECFSAELDYESTTGVNRGELPTMLRVPPGFTVVGGSGMGGYPSVVLCR